MESGGSTRAFVALGRAIGRGMGLSEIRIGQLSPPAAQRMRRQQIRGAIEQMRVFVVGNTFFAPVLAFQAWDRGINEVVIGWTTAMLFFSWWLFFHWRKSVQCDGRPDDMVAFVAETRLNATLWCLGMILFYPHVEGSGTTILACVMIGSLALGTVGFAQAPAAAFWYLGLHTVTMTFVPVLHGIMIGEAAHMMIGGLALVAGVAIFNASLERAKEQMRAFLGNEALKQKGEVIDLLLKDYEEQDAEWLWQTDAKGQFVSGPAQVLTILELSRDDLGQVNLIEAIAHRIEPGGQADLERVQRAFGRREDFHDVTLPIRDKVRGRPRWIMMRGRPQYDGLDFTGFRGIFADASKMMDARKQVEFLADHDPLTGAFNRNVVQRRLSELRPAKHVATAYLIDLDGFKQVNDSYGHGVGDALLRIVADRLNEEVSAEDLVARLGGDEFMILRPEKSGDDGSALADTLLKRLSEPFLIDQYDISISASIGTAEFPKDSSRGEDMLIKADLALYAAKQNVRNKSCAFLGSMQVGLQKRFLITERLKAAIHRDEIVPHYQPQYCSQSGRLVGFEALARWSDKELGRVGPDIFIPIAEETGLIHALGAQFLRRACSDAKAWKDRTVDESIVLSVNLSPVQMTRGDVVGVIRRTLEDTGLPASCLEVEITEGVLIHDMAAACKTLDALSDLGVRIALDDFGTGYSSLSYVRALPLDRLKIDRAFIKDIEDPDARPVVQTIIDLCRSLGLCVVAEGVETAVSVQLLQQMGCDVLQGYFFSPPVPADAALILLDEDRGKPDSYTPAHSSAKVS